MSWRGAERVVVVIVSARTACKVQTRTDARAWVLKRAGIAIFSTSLVIPPHFVQGSVDKICILCTAARAHYMHYK